MSDDVEWMRSAKVLEVLAPLGKGEFHLRQACRIGKVRSRAAHARISRSRSSGGGEKEEFDWPVPADIWKGSAENSAFSLHDDYYSSGSCSGSIGTVQLAGLSFNKAEIVAWFEINEAPGTVVIAAAPEAAPAPGETVANNGGRPVEKELWGNFMAALGAYAQSGEGIKPGERAGTLYRKVTEFGASLGLDDYISLDTARSALNRAMELVQKAEAAED